MRVVAELFSPTVPHLCLGEERGQHCLSEGQDSSLALMTLGLALLYPYHQDHLYCIAQSKEAAFLSNIASEWLGQLCAVLEHEHSPRWQPLVVTSVMDIDTCPCWFMAMDSHMAFGGSLHHDITI